MTADQIIIALLVITLTVALVALVRERARRIALESMMANIIGRMGKAIRAGAPSESIARVSDYVVVLLRKPSADLACIEFVNRGLEAMEIEKV